MRSFYILELVDLVLVVSKLLEVTGQLSLVPGADLVSANSLVQARRTTDEDLDILLLRLRKDGLQQLLGDVTLTTSPSRWGLVEEVEGLEALRVGVLNLIPLLLQKDVLLSDIAEHQGNLGLVLGVLEDVTGELVGGGDTSTSCDQDNVLVLVGLPGVLGKRTFEVHALANAQAVEVFGHGAIGIFLDNELEEAGNVYML